MWLLALHGCTPIGTWDLLPGDDTAVGEARIVASPGALDFGTISVNTDGYGVGELTLYNVGGTTETVTGHDEPLGSSAFVVDAPPVIVLDAGDALTLSVRYLPGTEQSDVAELLISPGEETVRFLGEGAAPVLATESPAFDPVVVGCAGVGTIPISNQGSEALDIVGAALDGEEFVLVDVPSGLSPGETGAVSVRFTPGGGGERGTTLRLSSNDPLRPELGVPVSALGYEGERVTESFRYTPSNPTDLLFVVTTAGGMSTQLAKAMPVIGPFVDALRDTNIDYHLAAVSGASPCPSSTPGWADRSDTSLQAEIVLERGLSGGVGPWDGDLLGLALEAVTRAEASDCLVGFRREEADLHVILLADGPGTADPAPAAAALAARVASPATLHVSALLPDDDSCGAPAPAYATIVSEYGGAREDLCANNWAPAFDAFADLPDARATVRYTLAEIPVPSTIEVLAEGVVFPDWTWDASQNAIAFDGEVVPALGAEITVRYVSSVACE